MTRDLDRDIRELAQAIATLEVVLTALAAARQPTERARVAQQLRAHADRAVFELHGLDPVQLDRIAGGIETNSPRINAQEEAT